jgi:ribonucleoside-diphosphate reductase alpha chain
MFKHIREQADDASFVLADERGSCPDAAEWGVHQRFSCKMSLAPTASISIIAGNSSPGIEPIATNAFLQKTLSGSHIVRNRHLKKLLAEKGQDTDEVWSSITLKAGSVQHLDFLTDHEKMVFRSAFELDRRIAGRAALHLPATTELALHRRLRPEECLPPACLDNGASD